MCGIAGILRVHRPDTPVPLHHEAIPDAWLDILDESIKHRGPDGAGRFRDRATRPDGSIVDIALVHRRLSIIDHAGGAQPMVHVRYPNGTGELLRPQRFVEDRIGGRPEGIGILDLTGETDELREPVRSATDIVAVVFNGCIYNHREFRKELEGLGHRFETDHSDTEVLVHGWRAWGACDGREAVLQRRFNSMHAALIWNRSNAATVTLRDPFGEKPLYFAGSEDEHGRVIAWASVTSGLVRLGPFERQPLLPSYKIRGWIRHGWSAGSLKNGTVREVRPVDHAPSTDNGTPVTGGFGVGHWIDLAGLGPSLSAESAEEMLRTAVRKRLEADVPLGCFLSGGIDSSLITRFAVEELGSVHAFTVAMPAAAYDESEFARAAARAIGAELHVHECEADPANDLSALIHRLGLPFGDSSLLPTYWVCRAAAREVRVALTGDGGDELFAGYERHAVAQRVAQFRWLTTLTPPPIIPARDPRSTVAKVRRLVEATRCGAGSLAAELSAIFPRRDLAALVGRHDLTTSDALGALKNRSTSVRLWDIDRYLREDLVRKTDTASMHVPIEVRSPFLDPDLAVAAMRTPLDVLMPNGQRKGLLKQVARKYLPPEIVDRPKQGFAIPIGEWFRTDYGSMRQLLYDHLESADPFPGLADAGVEINMAFVRRMLREHDAAGEKSINPWHGRDHSQRLYMLLVLSIWAKWLQSVKS